MHQIVCPRRAAFTLLEISIASAIVVVLAAVAVPAFSRITQSARAAACMSNLRQIGNAVNLYASDHNQTIPSLEAGRASKAEDKKVIDNTLDTYARNPAVFACPADNEGLARKTGTSYYWNIALNGQNLNNLNFLGFHERPTIPLISDKDPFHPYVDTKVNILYADGHADTARGLNFTTTAPGSSP